jgi:signal transduction histidine kinase
MRESRVIQVLGCLVERHRPDLVLLAGLVCLLSAYTAFLLKTHSRERIGRGARAWAMGAGIVAGVGIWATHFVAMLAFQPQVPIRYSIFGTAASVTVSIVLATVGFSIPVGRPHLRWLGGAVVGLAISAMHYFGMAAIRVAGYKHFQLDYVAASALIAIVFSVCAFIARAERTSPGRTAAAVICLVLAICGMHFTGMTALVVEPDPRMRIAGAFVQPDAIGAMIIAAVVSILVVALAASAIDTAIGRRAQVEAERLRSYVRELEATKAELEASAIARQAALEAAEAADRSKGQFLATMSHELRTPLNAVIGFSEMIELQLHGPLGDARYLEYVRHVASSGRHLLALINDVLDFAKADAGKLELDEEWVDLSEICRDCIDMMHPSAVARRVTLNVSADPGLPAACVDRRRFKQILLNLLSNAVKFTDAEGSVEVAVSLAGSTLMVAIRDTGIGIAPEDIPKALERFGQVDSRLARRYEGTGLGLPLAKMLADLHGIGFEISSALGAGTCVTLVIPPERVAPAAATTASA